jgi:hypothetical protein
MNEHINSASSASITQPKRDRNHQSKSTNDDNQGGSITVRKTRSSQRKLGSKDDSHTKGTNRVVQKQMLTYYSFNRKENQLECTKEENHWSREQLSSEYSTSIGRKI